MHYKWNIDRAIHQAVEFIKRLFPDAAYAIIRESEESAKVIVDKPNFPVIRLSVNNTTHCITDKLTNAVAEYCAANRNNS
jgi:hypothetical protein